MKAESTTSRHPWDDLLPAAWFQLQRWSAQHGGVPERVEWVGPVGWLVTDPGEPQVEQLLRRRWIGMHPDLIPFAQDESYHAFCFVVLPDRPGVVSGIVHWNHETRRAIPLAGSFDTFLDWVALAAQVPWFDDPFVQGNHFDTVRAAWRDLARDMPLLAPESERIPAAIALHTTLRDMQDDAAGSLLLHALELHGARNPGRCDRMLDAALQAFPPFTGVHAHRALILQKRNADLRAERDALCDAVLGHHVYLGDSFLPYVPHVPEVSVRDLTDRLVEVSEALTTRPAHIPDPLWELVFDRSTHQPEGWLEAARELNTGLGVGATPHQDAARFAIQAGCNALQTSDVDSHGRSTARFLLQLYRELGCDLHVRIAEEDLALRRNKLPSGR